MDRVLSDAATLTQKVADITEPPLPTIGLGEQVQVAIDRLESAPALLVLDRGHPIGVVTRSDILSSLSS